MITGVRVSVEDITLTPLIAEMGGQSKISGEILTLTPYPLPY